MSGGGRNRFTFSALSSASSLGGSSSWAVATEPRIVRTSASPTSTDHRPGHLSKLRINLIRTPERNAQLEKARSEQSSALGRALSCRARTVGTIRGAAAIEANDCNGIDGSPARLDPMGELRQTPPVMMTHGVAPRKQSRGWLHETLAKVPRSAQAAFTRKT